MFKHIINAIFQKSPPILPVGMAQDKEGNPHELKLYKFDSCPYCQRVMPALKKLNIPIELRDIRQDPTAKQELMDIGGKTQVPCLVIDGQPLYESQDIIHYLNKHYA